MRFLVKGLYSIDTWFMKLSGLLIAASTLFAAVNAIMRYLPFVVASFPWAEELTTYGIVLMVFLAAPKMEISGDQLCISAIMSLVKSDRGRTILNYIRGIVTVAAMIILIYYGRRVSITSYNRELVTYVLQIPKWILYAFNVLCYTFVALSWVVILFFNKGRFEKGSAENGGSIIDF